MNAYSGPRAYGSSAMAVAERLISRRWFSNMLDCDPSGRILDLFSYNFCIS
jgi:hypothetical protein